MAPSVGFPHDALCRPSHRGIAFAFRCALARMYFWVYKVDSMAEQFALGGRSWCTLPRPGRGPGDMHQWQVRCVARDRSCDSDTGIT